MLLDSIDFEFLKLTGLCRYMPTGLNRKYDSPCFKRRVIFNLQEHRFIKLMSDRLSYKLTKRGRDVLAEMGIEFTKDARTNIKRSAYVNKLKNAQLNIVLSLAGINVYYKTARELTGVKYGYMSSLSLRSDNNMKVLSGAKFLGVLKFAEIAYIPYYIENKDSWVYPQFEKETYLSQIETVKDVKEVQLLLAGNTLEELWSNLSQPTESVNIVNGQKPFYSALEEFGCEYSLIPVGKEGVLQMSVMTLWRYRERIAEAVGCSENNIGILKECDGFIEGKPCIIGVDFNVKRITRALNQIKKYNKDLIPTIFCLPFQKKTMFKLLERNFNSKTYVVAISKKDIYNVFPELNNITVEKKPCITKWGEYIDIPEKYNSKNSNECDED